MSSLKNIRRAALAAVLTGMLWSCGESGDGNGWRPVEYQVVCTKQHGLVRGWEGPRRASEEKAREDVLDHRRFYPDHQPTIVERK